MCVDIETNLYQFRHLNYIGLTYFFNENIKGILLRISLYKPTGY